MSDTRTYAAVPAKRLKTDVLSTDAVFKLTDIVWYKENDGDSVNLSSSNFGTVGYGVWEPDNDDRREFFTWDPTTIANYATTGITVLSRGLVPDADYSTESSARKFFHPAQSRVLLSTNSPAFYNNFANKNNDETITQTWTFTSTKIPIYDSHPTFTDDKHLIDKKYADDLAISGSPNASSTVKGIIELATVAEQGTATANGATGAALVPANANLTSSSSGSADASKIPILNAGGVLSQTFLDTSRNWATPQLFTADTLQISTDCDSDNDAVRRAFLFTVALQNRGSGTAGESLVLGDWVYAKASDGKLYKTDGDADESTYSVVGVALTTAATDATVYYAKPGGVVTGLTGLTAGSYYFLSGTAGAIAATPHATRLAKVAQALSTTSLRVIEPKFIRRGTVTISGTGATAEQTTGFYPSKLVLYAFNASAAGSMSIGDESNQCIRTSQTLSWTRDATKAFKVRNSADGGETEGTVSARSQAGFTLSTATYQNNVTIQWEAESL